MRAHHSSLPLHDPLGVALSHNVLDDRLALDGLISRHHLLSLALSFLVAADIIAYAVKAKAVDATLLPIYLCRYLRHLLVEVVKVVVLQYQVYPLMDAFKQFGIRWIALSLCLNLQVPQRVLNLLYFFALRVY